LNYLARNSDARISQAFRAPSGVPDKFQLTISENRNKALRALILLGDLGVLVVKTP
jgi:hypothetical protein